MVANVPFHVSIFGRWLPCRQCLPCQDDYYNKSFLFLRVAMRLPQVPKNSRN